MKVLVDQIPQQGLVVTRRLDPAGPEPWLLRTLEDVGGYRAPLGARLELRLLKVQREVRVTGDVALTLEGPCARCAEDMAFSLLAPIDVALVPVEEQPKALETGEVRAEDIGVGAYENGQLDVGQLLHDEILLELPAQLLCQEDCAGRCSHCGNNKNLVSCRCADGVSATHPFAQLAKAHKA